MQTFSAESACVVLEPSSTTAEPLGQQDLPWHWKIESLSGMLGVPLSTAASVVPASTRAWWTSPTLSREREASFDEPQPAGSDNARTPRTQTAKNPVFFIFKAAYPQS